MTANVPSIATADDLKVFLAKNYMAQIKNFFGDERRAMKFLSSVMANVQKVPKLLECEPLTVINSFMTMAQLNLMPSDVSGEAYVLPYNNTKRMPDGSFVKVQEAQFQLGYQGLVTLFYMAGVERIVPGIVRKNDVCSMVNGEIRHEVPLDKSAEERGAPIGAYVSVTFRGHTTTKYMNGKDILEHGRKFSKSFDLTGKNSPWNPANDPELWMWIKTVLKQIGKMLPKNEAIFKAIAADNGDSVISDRKLEGLAESSKLSMGNFAKNANKENGQIPAGSPAESGAGAGAPGEPAGA